MRDGKFSEINKDVKAVGPYINVVGQEQHFLYTSNTNLGSTKIQFVQIYFNLQIYFVFGTNVNYQIMSLYTEVIYKELSSFQMDVALVLFINQSLKLRI